MGSQITQADYVQTAAYTAASRAISGNTGSVPFARKLEPVNPAYYLFYDFPFDVLGCNPARGFQGSIAGFATPGNPIQSGNTTIVPLTITMHDLMTAQSGTRASSFIGGYTPGNETAVFNGNHSENPYGASGPMRTIVVDYHLDLLVIYENNVPKAVIPKPISTY